MAERRAVIPYAAPRARSNPRPRNTDMSLLTPRAFGASLLALLSACASSPRASPVVASVPRAVTTHAVPALRDAAADRREVVRAILEEALAHGQAYAKLESLCSTAPKRLSGSPDAEKAVAWAQRRFEDDGFDGAHLEHCTVPVWVRGARASLDVVEPKSAGSTKLPIAALGGS